MSDLLVEMFEAQQVFMDDLKLNGKLETSDPVNLNSRPGQKLVRDTIFSAVEELIEAGRELKSRTHKSKVGEVDEAKLREELADVMAYFIEVCLLCGLDEEALHEEFMKKNAVCRRRLADGY